MSQSTNPHAQRSVAGMIGAMIVAVVVAGAWYLIGRPNEDVQPVQAIEWSAQQRAARSDALLLTFGPDSLQTGWKATSASYQTGVTPQWHLGVLTDHGKYIGIDETRNPVRDLVEKYVDQNADQGPDVVIGGRTWQTWTDSGGDYALSWTQQKSGLTVESVVIGGSAPAATIRTYVGSLTVGTVKTLS